MDEARAVLARLDRIEALDRAAAPPGELLAEVRALLAEAEAWVRSESGGTARAEWALEASRAALEGPGLGCELAGLTPEGRSRTLVA